MSVVGGGKTGYRWGTRDLATLINLTGNQHQTTRSGGGGCKGKGRHESQRRKKRVMADKGLQKGSAKKGAFSRHIAAFA